MEEFLHIDSKDVLIGKYLSGNASFEEEQKLLHWMKLSQENQQYFAAYKIIWLKTGIESHTNQAQKWEQLESRIDSRKNQKLEFENLIEDTREKTFRMLRNAAVIIGLLGISAVMFYIFQSKNKYLTTTNVIEVPYGSKSVLTLPDGTKLWVNSGSKITYNNKFGIDNRNIEIEGEAYFDVARNAELPFIVHAGKIDIKALGTAFNVKAYPEENSIETTLVHGSVEIVKEGKNHKAIILKPSEKLVITKDNNDKPENHPTPEAVNIINETLTGTSELIQEGFSLNKAIDIEKETSWKDGKLIFDEEPLETLAVQLERRYDVKFSFSDFKLRTYRYTGTFPDLSLEQILEAMKYSSPIDYEIYEKNVTLKEKPH